MCSLLLTLIPLTWRIWWAPNNASKGQTGFNLAFKGLIFHQWDTNKTIHIEITNKMQHCIKIYYPICKWSWTCFGRHTSHHQELKTALAASGFAYVRGCWTLRLMDAAVSSNLNVQQPLMYAKREAASAVLSSWWWAVCRPKHVQPHLHME